MNLTNSEQLIQRALKVFPGGANTISKYPNRRNKYPIIDNGYGSKVWDKDKNRYIDWTAGLGAIVLGYDFDFSNYRDEAGNLFASVTEEEILLAEKLIDIIPCAEQVRFFKTGSECASAAIRLARAIIDRDEVLYCGYHGWHDWYAEGLPYPKDKGTFDQCVCDVDYGELGQIEDEFKYQKPACLIIEPVNRIYPDKASIEYLKEVRRLCTKYNVLLIFDEIISGFRYDIGGISTLLNIEPDLACYSKAMANGYPLAVLVGKEKYMKHLEELQVSGTFNGERSAIIQALNTIEVIEKENVCQDLTLNGLRLANTLRETIKEYDYDFVELKGFYSWFKLNWKDEEKRRKFYDYVLENGIYSIDDHFVMFTHTQQDIDKTLEVYEKGFKIL